MSTRFFENIQAILFIGKVGLLTISDSSQLPDFRDPPPPPVPHDPPPSRPEHEPAHYPTPVDPPTPPSPMDIPPSADPSDQLTALAC